MDLLLKSHKYYRQFGPSPINKCLAIIESYEGFNFKLYYHLENVERYIRCELETDLCMIDGYPMVLLTDLAQALLKSDCSEYIKQAIASWKTTPHSTIDGVVVSQDSLLLVPMSYVSQSVRQNKIDLQNVCFSNDGSEVYLTYYYYKKLVNKRKQKSFAVL